MDAEEHQLSNLAQMAVLQLEINVPIMSVGRRGRVLLLYLYNRDEAVEWTIPETVKLPGDEMVMVAASVPGDGGMGSKNFKKKRGAA